MTSNQDYLKEAVQFRDLLLVGKCEPNEVIQWADRVIIELEDPPIEIIDLSMLGSQAKVPDVLSALNAISKDA